MRPLTIFLVELKIRQKLGSIEKGTLLLTVEDPKPNIGSGSATLNALLCVAERLAAERGQTVGALETFCDRLHYDWWLFNQCVYLIYAL